MKKIPLTKGKHALVDDEDFDELSRYKWSVVRAARGKLYARRGTQIGGRGGPYKHISMSRYLLGLEKGDAREADHVNGNTLDNRRSNLRVATRSQNVANAGSLGGASKYRGVSKTTRGGPRKIWTAHFRNKTIGYYEDEREAARAYDEAAYGYFNQHARLNFPEGVCS